MRMMQMTMRRMRAPQMWRMRQQRGRARPYLGLPAMALGALGMFFLDPARGATRRARARDWMMSRFRRFGTMFGRGARAVTSEAYGMSQQVQHREFEDWSVPNDATLTERVQSELFRDRSIPKGQLTINAEAGIVVLRGEVDHPAQLKQIEHAVEQIPGVRGVHNLLHLPGTPAPDRGSVLPAR